MRRIGWIVAFLLSAGWIACALSTAAVQSCSECRSVWRRTRDGWEHQDRLFRTRPLPPPAVHPAMVAALQVLLPLALLGLAARGRKPAPTNTQPARPSAMAWCKRHRVAQSLCLPWKRDPFTRGKC
jgi:hypothetical protein